MPSRSPSPSPRVRPSFVLPGVINNTGFTLGPPAIPLNSNPVPIQLPAGTKRSRTPQSQIRYGTPECPNAPKRSPPRRTRTPPAQVRAGTPPTPAAPGRVNTRRYSTETDTVYIEEILRRML